MAVYLRDHAPARDQYRSPRRSRPTGLTVMHTAESIMDSVGTDTGAENVAAFIRGRKEAGSYHDLVDADTALQLVRYEDEAYQDGTGSNSYALSISFACRTTDWVKMSPTQRSAFLAQGARAFVRQQTWLKDNGYPTTPFARVDRAQSAAGKAGFIPHAERDPERRSDPGGDFPWMEFFAQCRAALAGTPTRKDRPAMWLAKHPANDTQYLIDGGHVTALNRFLYDQFVAVGVPTIKVQSIEQITGAFNQGDEIAGLKAQLTSLTGAVGALTLGEKFDEAKFLEGVRSATAQGIIDAGEALRVVEEAEESS